MLSISVVMPTYNGSAFIAEALSSVFAQTVLPNEIIVVDDCSKDGTCDIVERLSKQSRIPLRLIRSAKNSGGPARPINIGVGAAGSDLIAVLDQDDLFVENKIECDVKALSEHPQAAASAGLRAFTSNPDVIPTGTAEICNGLGIEPGPESHIIPGPKMLRQLIARGFFWAGFPSFTFRKKHWIAKGGVDERLPVAADYDFMCYLSEQGDIMLRPAIHYLRRAHAHNVCNNHQKLYLDIARVRARHLNTHNWILQEEAESRFLLDFFTGLSYWLREAGNHRAALECYRMIGKVWGYDQKLIGAALKVPLHWALLRLGLRRPVYTPYTVRLAR